MPVSVSFHIDQLFTILRLIDYRITGLRTATATTGAEQALIDEAVHLTKFRMSIQDHVNRINDQGC